MRCTAASWATSGLMSGRRGETDAPNRSASVNRQGRSSATRAAPDVSVLLFFEKILADTCPFMGPLIPLFWTSDYVFSRCQSQSGQPYSHFLEMNMLHVAWDSPLVQHLPTSWWLTWQLVTASHMRVSPIAVNFNFILGTKSIFLDTKSLLWQKLCRLRDFYVN